MTTELHFQHGTLVVPVLPDSHAHRALRFDERTGVWRAPAHQYSEIVLAWNSQNLAFDDRAAAFVPYPMRLRERIMPYPYQQAALEAWSTTGRRGVVVLPTGAGKTWLAILAMVETGQPTLVVVPTLDLLQQWTDLLHKRLGVAIGTLGGGQNVQAPVTVATYDSAVLHTEFLGNKFGLLVFDECHHLPAPSYQFIAAGSLAPFRLGLSATLDRADGGERICYELVGPLCHSVTAHALRGEYLSRYEIRQVEVQMTDGEEAQYQHERGLYIDFLRTAGVRLSQPDGWAQFVIRSSQSEVGRRAMRAYRAQRRIALTCSGKLAALWRILLEHRHERAIIFTDDNETVHRLSTLLLLPSITHHTKPPERRALLAAFAQGELPALLTSRVLNEGVDVPDANIGVVLSGSGSVREHVQRLGRILRKRPDKRAILYELCSATGAERGISERRRQHQVYQDTGPAC